MPDQNSIRRLIEQKRSGGALAPAQWRKLIAAFMRGDVGEGQMAALLMAVVWRGMEPEEVVALTDAMVQSGRTIEFSLAKCVVDKHSSGGVGDLVSLLAVPLVAACGVPVAKLSGRALGHTGGTIDKLEAIPGFRTGLTGAEFKAQVERIGCAIAAQTADMVPADKRIYELRDRTGTVPARGLICASIVSKKIAGGADAFVFDVKVGNGAFMRDVAAAADLARLLVRTSEHFGKSASGVVSNMDEPLATCIGTGLEVAEARDFLTGKFQDPRAMAVCLTVCSEMLRNGRAGQDDGALRRALDSGAAYEKFVEMIEAQGASRAALERLRPPAPRDVTSPKAGIVGSIDVVELGNLGRLLSTADSMAGIRMRKRIGDRVDRGEVLAELHGGDDAVAGQIAGAFAIERHGQANAQPLVYEVIGAARGLSA